MSGSSQVKQALSLGGLSSAGEAEGLRLGKNLCAWSEVCVDVCTRACLFFFLSWGQLNLGHFSIKGSLLFPSKDCLSH